MSKKPNTVKLNKDVVNDAFPITYITPRIYGKNYHFVWDQNTKGIPAEDEKYLKQFIEDCVLILPHSLDAIEQLKQKSNKITNLRTHDSAKLYEPIIQLKNHAKYCDFTLKMTWDSFIFLDASQRASGSIYLTWNLGELRINDPMFDKREIL